MKRVFGRMLAISMVAALGVACGDDGYGRTVPPDEYTCDNVCAQLADCGVYLCNEDTNSTDYTPLWSQFHDDCTAGCDQAELDQASAEQLEAIECIFRESCRDVFEHGVCDPQASYTCY